MESKYKQSRHYTTTKWKKKNMYKQNKENKQEKKKERKKNSTFSVTLSLPFTVVR